MPCLPETGNDFHDICLRNVSIAITFLVFVHCDMGLSLPTLQTSETFRL